MMTFTLQATLIASIPVEAQTCADSKRKLRAALASSRLHVEMLDDESIAVAVEIEGDLDLLDAVDCIDSTPPRTHRPRASASSTAPHRPKPAAGKASSKEAVSGDSEYSSACADRKTRRAALGALVAASALAIPAIGPIASALADPVFGAIERHRIAYEAALAVGVVIDELINDPEGRPLSDADWEAYDRAREDEEAAFARLLACAPQTAAGTRAIIAHLIGIDDGRLSEKMRRLLALLLLFPVLAG